MIIIKKKTQKVGKKQQSSRGNKSSKNTKLIAIPEKSTHSRENPEDQHESEMTGTGQDGDSGEPGNRTGLRGTGREPGHNEEAEVFQNPFGSGGTTRGAKNCWNFGGDGRNLPLQGSLRGVAGGDRATQCSGQHHSN